MEEMEVRRLDGAKVPLGTMPSDLVHDVLVKHEGPFISGLLTSGSAAESRGISNISRLARVIQCYSPLSESTTP